MSLKGNENNADYFLSSRNNIQQTFVGKRMLSIQKNKNQNLQLFAYSK